MKLMKVNVVTPNGMVYESEAHMVIAGTVDGEIGILPSHAPIIAPLDIDEVKVEKDEQGEQGEVDFIAVNGGILEVRDNVISILADSAEREEEIDVPRAERAKQRAEKRIAEAKEGHTDVSLDRATVALHRAMNRLNVSKHR